MKGLGFGIGRRLERFWKTKMLPKTQYARFEVQGHDMVVKMQRNMIQTMYYRNIYEPETTAYMKKHIKKGDVVVDVGANIGYFTLIMARAVGPTGKVLAFEPSDELRAILQRNVKVNGYSDRVEIFPHAVSDNIGTATFFLNRGHGQNSLIPRKGTVEVMKVKTTTLDKVLEAYPTTKIVKIDVEGAESDVLRGMKKTLNRIRNLAIIFEFLPTHTGFSWMELEELLSAYVLTGLDHNLLAKRNNK